MRLLLHFGELLLCAVACVMAFVLVGLLTAIRDATTWWHRGTRV